MQFGSGGTIGLITMVASCIYLSHKTKQLAGIAVCHDAVTFLREFFKIPHIPKWAENSFSFSAGSYMMTVRLLLSAALQPLDGAWRKLSGYFHQAVDAYGYFPAARRICIPAPFQESLFPECVLQWTKKCCDSHDSFAMLFPILVCQPEPLLGVPKAKADSSRSQWQRPLCGRFSKWRPTPADTWFGAFERYWLQ